jgi:DNA-binding transcriptional ArsR family regulator
MPRRAPKMAPAQPVVLRDPSAIKALAHPARLVVLDEFMAGRELTATECADLAGLSPSAMSYHLRSLARWEIILPVESPDGRERRWKIHPGGFIIESSQPRISGIAEAAVAGRFLDRARSQAVDWLTHNADVPLPWQDSMTLTATFAWLTPAETKQLQTRLSLEAESFRGRSETDHPAGAKRVQIGVLIVPDRQLLNEPD